MALAIKSPPVLRGGADRSSVTIIERFHEHEPCMYAGEEIRASVMQRTKDFYDGKMELVPHDQIQRKVVV